MFVKQSVKQVRQGGFMTGEERHLNDLVSIGPAMLRDFELLGVRTVAQLARRNPEKMYEKLCQVTGQAQDICCLDVFRAAVAQAKNSNLPIEQRLWWQWSRKRKASHASH
jgi:predicted RecB family nuclease